MAMVMKLFLTIHCIGILTGNPVGDTSETELFRNKDDINDIMEADSDDTRNLELLNNNSAKGNTIVTSTTTSSEATTSTSTSSSTTTTTTATSTTNSSTSLSTSITTSEVSTTTKATSTTKSSLNTTLSTSLSTFTSTSKVSTSATSTTSTSAVTSTQVSPDHPIPGWGLAIICLAVAIIVFILGWIFFVRYRRSKIPLARPVNSMFRKNTENRKTSDSAIVVTSFDQTFRNRSMRGDITKEFEMIQEFSAALNIQKTRDVGQSEINNNRNRFIDIIPFDDNHVSLSTEQGLPPSSYINASYIDNMDALDKIIVTQGPKQNTVLDFWKMVLEKKCSHVIMLTNCQEQGRVKCFQYWPPSGQMLHFDDISLFTSEETEIHTGLIMRKIEVTLEDDDDRDTPEVHIVRQLHLTNWPDHGVPEHVNSILAFVKVASTFKDSDYTVVHCSAGVGRTGTYLALASLTEQVQGGCGSIDIMKTVLKLREKRPKMVQTQEQYLFLYQCMAVFVRRWITGEVAVDTKIVSDTVLDAGIDNFGFEHVKL